MHHPHERFGRHKQSDIFSVDDYIANRVLEEEDDDVKVTEEK